MMAGTAGKALTAAAKESKKKSEPVVTLVDIEEEVFISRSIVEGLKQRKAPQAEVNRSLADVVHWENAYKQYFENWDVPRGGDSGRYSRAAAYYPCESLDPPAGEFITNSAHRRRSAPKR